MRGYNKVFLIGHLGKDPETRFLEGNVPVVNFPLATTETFKDKGGNRNDQTEWHNIVLWRGLAELASKYLKKGSFIFIEGKIRTRSWEDRDGNKRYTTEIVGDNFSMLDPRKQDDMPNVADMGAGFNRPQDSGMPIGNQPDDDLPF